jgi:Cys-rich protein (TIGR01571 family)
MTRTGLDWHGNPANKLVSSMSCTNMTVLLTFWLAINASAAFMYRVSWERGFDIGSNYHTPLIIFNIFVMIWMITLTKKVRESIRNKYQIPEDKCEGVEDCLCATFCMPCAICQMGRHTADFDTYRATWCTKTGLPRQVELAPVTFYEEDQYQTMNDDGGQII